ncbi:acyltransferase PGAP2-like [Saccoglossus kowalevskii]
MPHPVLWYIKLCRTAFTLQLVEILSLLGLTMVASREYKPAHEIFFVTFIMSSLLYMIAMNLQYYLSRKKLWNAFTLEEQKHQKRLLGLFIFNITCFFVSMYFFYRHNRYCEPGVYSIYALVESIIIVSNITFHVAESAMFTKKEIVFGTESLKSPPKSD